MEKAPTAAGQLLIAADLLIGPRTEYVLCAGDDPAEFAAALATVRRKFRPNVTLATRIQEDAHRCAALDELFAGRISQQGQTALYICQNFACQSPLVGVDAIRAALSD
jgi:uncharacterized protein YyaL (SSP411 family)